MTSCIMEKNAVSWIFLLHPIYILLSVCGLRKYVAPTKRPSEDPETSPAATRKVQKPGNVVKKKKGKFTKTKQNKNRSKQNSGIKKKKNIKKGRNIKNIKKQKNAGNFQQRRVSAASMDKNGKSSLSKQKKKSTNKNEKGQRSGKKNPNSKKETPKPKSKKKRPKSKKKKPKSKKKTPKTKTVKQAEETDPSVRGRQVWPWMVRKWYPEINFSFCRRA